MKYEFIDRERSCHPVAKTCLVLGVSRSGYYAHGSLGHGIRQKANERMLEEIKRSYKVGRGAYGSPRITTDLRDRGYLCGKNRVARLMRINGITAKTKRRFKATTTNSRGLNLYLPRLDPPLTRREGSFFNVFVTERTKNHFRINSYGNIFMSA